MNDSKAGGEDGSPGKRDVTGAMEQAALYLAQSSHYPPMTPEIEKRLIRKLDWILVPMVILAILNRTSDADKLAAVPDSHTGGGG